MEFSNQAIISKFYSKMGSVAKTTNYLSHYSNDEHITKRPTIWLIEGHSGRILAVQPKSSGFEPDPSHCVSTLSKLFTSKVLCAYDSLLCK